MKIVLLIIVILVVGLIVFNKFVNRSIKTEITIDSSTEKIWTVLMDHENYPSWNPFIRKISGSQKPGEKLAATIGSEGNKPMDFAPLVLVNDKEKEFRWVGKVGISRIMDGEHYFLLEPQGAGQTRFIQGEDFTGLLSGIFMLMIREDTEGGFNAMNVALKGRVENQ